MARGSVDREDNATNARQWPEDQLMERTRRGVEMMNGTVRRGVRMVANEEVNDEVVA
jgi:hypothetical protein